MVYWTQYVAKEILQPDTITEICLIQRTNLFVRGKKEVECTKVLFKVSVHLKISKNAWVLNRNIKLKVLVNKIK